MITHIIGQIRGEISSDVISLGLIFLKSHKAYILTGCGDLIHIIYLIGTDLPVFMLKDKLIYLRVL